MTDDRTEPKTLVYPWGPWWLLGFRCPAANMAFRVSLNRRRFSIVKGQRGLVVRWKRDWADD